MGPSKPGALWGPRHLRFKRMRGSALCMIASMSTDVPVEVLRADAVRLLLSGIVAASGIGACLLWFPRARRHDFSLLYFGIAAAMYGIRLVATSATISYLTPEHTRFWQRMDWIITSLIIVPFTLFFVETVAPQWKKVSYWILGVSLIIQSFVLPARWIDAKRTLA